MAQPFSHEELIVKQHFVNLAREYHANISSDSLEKELAAALLYMNLADYLAEYLVSGFEQLTKDALGKYFLGVISYSPPQREGFNLGTSIHQLEKYDFPQKTAVLAELKAINAARKVIAHQMFKISATKLERVDQAERDLQAHTEKLVEIVDEISLGLPPKTLLEKVAEAADQTATEVATMTAVQDVEESTNSDKK